MIKRKLFKLYRQLGHSFRGYRITAPIQTGIILALIAMISLLGINSAYSATPFFANDAFTQNGIEWCEENYSLYEIIGDEFFEHHKHSIEARVCVSLYNDPLWTYTGPDRYEKLIEKSRYYVELEIAESAEEAKTGVVNPTPAMTRENKTEVMETIESEEQNNEEPIKEEVQTQQDSGGGCLIATATLGTELAPQVQQMREIRDSTLLKTNSGSAFMDSFNTMYYSFSPTVADWERQNPMFKEATKLFITPMISSLSIMSLAEDSSENEVIMLGALVIAVNSGMYVGAPVVATLQIRKLLKT